ncbi:MAG: anthranilate synthase component I [Spirochaetes bacterium]|nr:anthranilate synthase component I [Spirochaetota bacterium]
MQLLPAIDDIQRIADEGSYNIVPVYAELLGDFDTPTAIYSRLRSDNYAFLLESITGGENLARYSFIGYNPSRVIRITGNKVTVDENGSVASFEHADPLSYVNERLLSYRGVPVEGLPPFYGGAVGFFSYDAVRYIERIPDNNPRGFECPDVFYVFTDKIIVFDHIENRIHVLYNILLDGTPVEALYEQAKAHIASMISAINAPAPLMKRDIAPAKEITYSSNYTKDSFCAMVERAKEYIRCGDIFQVVLSQRFTVPAKGIDPLNIYRALRLINPSPYMFSLKFGGIEIIGSSPEILVKQADGRVSVRPIAGTRKRGANAAEDEALAKELLADTKEMAEHLMLVDLGRNDVGRVSEYGSVSVTERNIIERYAHVMHIVSNVEGALAKGKTNIDVLKSAFPAGTVSGAPKVRAMEIIDELETVRRGPYAGCVGYFSFSGNMDTGIMIRTIYVAGDEIHIQAGAGIVYDSVPEKEYEETINKAKSLMKALELAASLS